MSYEKDAKKYKLPGLKDIENVFGLKIDEGSSLRDVFKEIMERFRDAKNLIEPVLFIHEGSSPCCFYESSVLGKEKKVYLDLYKKIMEIEWYLERIYFDGREKSIAEALKRCYDVWRNEVRDKILEFAKKMEDGWRNYKGKKNHTQPYLG
ncbi:MAG: hypothetical protein DRP11_02885 [Candidatus Aenigmatarchaeota archaeon]|nr:MAG: hypothetical protein DRP11_02885 [Candidatus Aenigmarchaeota archaeon]